MSWTDPRWLLGSLRRIAASLGPLIEAGAWVHWLIRPRLSEVSRDTYHFLQLLLYDCTLSSRSTGLGLDWEDGIDSVWLIQLSATDLKDLHLESVSPAKTRPVWSVFEHVQPTCLAQWEQSSSLLWIIHLGTGWVTLQRSRRIDAQRRGKWGHCKKTDCSGDAWRWQTTGFHDSSMAKENHSSWLLLFNVLRSSGMLLSHCYRLYILQ